VFGVWGIGVGLERKEGNESQGVRAIELLVVIIRKLDLLSRKRSMISLSCMICMTPNVSSSVKISTTHSPHARIINYHYENEKSAVCWTHSTIYAQSERLISENTFRSGKS
jgi:hypothetical protein